LGITKQYVLTRLRDLLKQAMTPTPKTWQGQPVVVDGETIMEIDGSTAVRAIELLATPFDAPRPPAHRAER
jgi:hypothetical protein